MCPFPTWPTYPHGWRRLVHKHNTPHQRQHQHHPTPDTFSDFPEFRYQMPKGGLGPTGPHWMSYVGFFDAVEERCR